MDEGATFAGDGSFTDPGSDAWDATVDYGDGAGPEPLALDSGQTFTLNHRYADDGSYVVTVTVTDDNGGVGADTLVVTVVNTSPVVDAGPDVSLDEGSTFAGSGSFTDSGSDTWTGSVDYGDGSAVEPLALDSDQTFRLSHTYSSTGVYMVTVRVADDDGGVGTDALTVTWISAAPVVTILEALPAHVDEGSPTLLTATFTDPDAADTHAVDWDLGNGASLPYGLDPGTRTVNLQQTYVDDGSFLVGFRVTDGEGYSDQADVQVEVLNVAPTFEPPLTDLTVGEGTALSVAVTAVDASRVDVLDVSATGIPPGATFGSVTDVGRATGTLAWTPSCEQAGTYTVAFTASDDDGGVVEATLRVTVTDACAAVVAVTNTGDNTVSLIDGGSHQVVNTFSVGLKPVDVAFYDLTFTAAVRALDTHTHVPPVSLYVTDRGQRAVDDKRANGMMRVLTGPQSPEPATAWSFTPYNSMEVGKRPEAMALSPDGSQVWIANWNDDTITIVDRAAYQVIATVPLSRRQASKGRGAGSKTVGRRPTAIAFSADGAFAFVTGRNSNSLVVVSRALATTDPTHAVVAELVVGKQPEVLTVDATGTLAYVATRDGVTVVDVRVPQMPGVVGVLPLPRRLRGIVLSSDGTKLYASNDGADVVSVMAVQAAPTYLAPLGDIDVDMGPAGLAVLPARSSVAGDRVYVACERGHVVSVIDTTTDQVIAMVPVGASPVNVAVGIVPTRLR